ncbi:MAG: DUF4249 domain-containing protein [Flavobacteriales bacterium]|nr:DUF4249 domain-containing protein [Flavobacteriales bacterium]
MGPLNRFGLLLGLVVITIAGPGCRKYIDFEGEDMPLRLVLNGIATADSTVTLHLSNSRGVIDPAPLAAITDGQVRLLDGEGNILETLVHLGDGRYRGNTTVAAGATITVQADAPGYGTASASDQVPFPVPVLQWDTTTVNVSEGQGFEFPALEMEFTFNDPGGQENHYLLEGFLVQSDSIIVTWDEQLGDWVVDTVPMQNPLFTPMSFSSTDQVLIAGTDVGVGDTRTFFTRAVLRDDLFNGTTRTITVRLENVIRPSRFELRWVSISATAYRYYRTLERYNYAEGDPFAEPVQVHSNVEGGLGIWGGANVARVTIGL